MVEHILNILLNIDFAYFLYSHQSGGITYKHRITYILISMLINYHFHFLPFIFSYLRLNIILIVRKCNIIRFCNMYLQPKRQNKQDHKSSLRWNQYAIFHTIRCTLYHFNDFARLEYSTWNNVSNIKTR